MSDAISPDNPGAAPTPPASKGPLILAFINSLAVLGALGMLIYTKLIYQRPAITEQGERARLAEAAASPVPPSVSGMIHFEPVTVNIQATPANPKAQDGSPRQIQGKLHYVTLGFSLEVRDVSLKPEIEAIAPLFMDKVLAMLGHKSFFELSTVQGRYVLRTQILDTANELLVKHLSQPAGARGPGAQNKPDPVVTGVYFNQFVVQ